MAFNSIAMKLAQHRDDSNFSDSSEMTHSSVSKKSSKKKQWDPDITEITVRIDSISEIKQLSGRFDLEKLRAESFEPVNLADLVKGYRDPKGRRTAPRHEIALTVVLYTNLRSFRTSTQNVSAGGVMLSEAIPMDFTDQPFDILFIYDDKTLGRKRYFMMKGQAIGTYTNTNRIQFKGTNPSTKESFQNFVEGLAA